MATDDGFHSLAGHGRWIAAVENAWPGGAGAEEQTWGVRNGEGITEHAVDRHGNSGHDDPLTAEHLLEHVKDAEYFHVPRALSPLGQLAGLRSDPDGKIHIPQWRESAEPIWQIKVGLPPVDALMEPLNLRITKFMVLEVIGCMILLVTFLPLAWRARHGAAPRGRMWNLLESMVVFIRQQVARPTIGAHDGDRFTPFLLTLFFFVLVCNLLGLVPWCGSPTGALATTGALALVTLGVVVVAGSRALGPVGFWLGQVPRMEVALIMKVPLWLLIFAIEVIGLLIKHAVLAMRLMANMMAGHVVLSVLSGFVAATGGTLALLGVLPASLCGSVAVSLLELFIAFLQAYIFTFLSGLFIGMAVHPH